MRMYRGERAMAAVNALTLLLVALCMLLPFVHVVAVSLSANQYVMASAVGLLPRAATLDSYRFAFTNTPVERAFQNTLFVTLVGTALSVVVTSMSAYPLTCRGFRGARAYMTFHIITMLFGGGLIPAFILMRSLGLLDNLWALILPHVVTPFNLILMRSYFATLPEEVREAGEIDGASPVTLFARVVLPMSLPILATIAVFQAVAYWNSYVNAMLYLSNPKMVTLQLFLVNIVKQAQLTDSVNSEIIVPPDGVRAAAVMIGTLPILAVYPLLQRYFVGGITLGAVKG